jgi:hypothetical protein
MELAARRVKVDLYEKCPVCVSGASAQNEGKIHLGFLFARDASLRSSKQMIRGALSFAPLLRRWLGEALDGIAVSSPFDYAVHASSMVDIDSLLGFFGAVHDLHLEALAGEGAEYFGMDLREPPSLLAGARSRLFDPSVIRGVIQTGEIAIDPEALAEAVRSRLAADETINILTGTEVLAVARDDPGLRVDFRDAGGSHNAHYDHVVNALWHGRLAIDASYGIMPGRPWSFRTKRFLRLSAAGDTSGIPSATIVLGPFGDVVNYDNGDIHLSWYPSGMEAFSTEMVPSDFLPLEGARATELRDATIAALSSIVPGLSNLDRSKTDEAAIKGGIIFAWGDTDIVDFKSELHERYAIGPHSDGSYHSVDTGKLTTAPLFAKAVADRIADSI